MLTAVRRFAVDSAWSTSVSGVNVTIAARREEPVRRRFREKFLILGRGQPAAGSIQALPRRAHAHRRRRSKRSTSPTRPRLCPYEQLLAAPGRSKVSRPCSIAQAATATCSARSRTPLEANLFGIQPADLSPAIRARRFSDVIAVYDLDSIGILRP
jgi:hypothetical protein